MFRPVLSSVPGERSEAMRKPVSEKTMADVERQVAANKAEAALAATGRPMTAREVRDVCRFTGEAKAARVLGGLVRKGIAKTLPPSAGCSLPRTWLLNEGSGT